MTHRKFNNVEGTLPELTLRNVLAAVLVAQQDILEAVECAQLEQEKKESIFNAAEGLFDIAMFAMGVPPDNEMELDYLYGAQAPEGMEFCWDFLYLTSEHSFGKGFKGNLEFLAWVADEMAKIDHPHVKAWRERRYAEIVEGVNNLPQSENNIDSGGLDA